VGSGSDLDFKGFTSMSVIIFTPSNNVEKLKQKARKLRKDLGLTHHEALDQVAKKYHYHHWHHVTEMAAITAPTEEAYRNGLLIAFDLKEADLDSDFFIETEIARFFCEDELWTAYLEIEDVEDPDFLDLPEEEQRSYFMETFESLAFYRFTGEKIPGSVEDALKLISEISFWPPEYIWLNGKLCETYGAPATDQDGNIVGVRF
jgi:hypothetical protein